MFRFTKENVEKVLAANEGFSKRTYYQNRNMEEENIYTITGGKLYKRSIEKTSWADSRYDRTVECDEEQTRRFLRDWKNKLSLGD